MCDCSSPGWHYLPKTANQKATIRDPRSKSKLMVENMSEKNFCVFHVDGGLLREEEGQTSCDYMLVVEQEKKAVLIELKGNDGLHGLKQISDTLKRLEEHLRSCKVLSGRLVSTEVKFAMRTPLYLQLDRLLRSRNGTLELSKMPLVL